MKKGQLLNQPVSAIVAGMEHMDELAIADDLRLVLQPARRVDFAPTQGMPPF